MLLAGCGDIAAIDVRPAVQVARDEAVFVSPALNATVRQFLGPTVPGGGGVLGGISGDTLSPDSTTPYDIDQSRRHEIAAGFSRPIAGGLSATARLAYGKGRSRYVLPEGAGILKDPIGITFATQYATVEGGVGWTQATGPRFGYDVEAAVGVRMTRTRTQIASALLDVRNTSHQHDPYAALRAGVWLAPDPGSGLTLRTGVEVIAYPGQPATIGATIAARY